jgi:hypothetical protein
MTIRDTFTLAHKLGLKKPPLSDSLALTSSNSVAHIGKALDGDAVFIMLDRWNDAVQEAEMGDSSTMKVNEQKHNTTYHDPDRR